MYDAQTHKLFIYFPVGFLWNFVCYIAAVCGNVKSNAAIQTEDSLTTESYISSLGE